MTIISSSGTPPLIFAQGRLTLVSGNPAPIADISPGLDIYYTFYNGNLISIYNGNVWLTREFSELTIPVPATVDTAYDVFIYDNSGVLTLYLEAWTDLNNRSVALARQNGIYVQSGTPIRRYLGSFRTLFASQCFYDNQRRWLWNYYNRVDSRLVVSDATPSWTYTTDTFRQANAFAENFVSGFVGVLEDSVSITATGCSFNNNAVAIQARTTGIGINSTTANAANKIGQVIPDKDQTFQTISKYEGYPVLGYTQFNWLEKSDQNVAGTTTWYGGDLSGMTGACKT